MNRIIIVAVMLTLGGCQSFRHLSDGATHAQVQKDFATGANLVHNGNFSLWPYGTGLHFAKGDNDADIPLCDGWLTFGGGAGVRPAHNITHDSVDGLDVVRFTLYDAGSGLNNSCRIYQKLEQFHPLNELRGQTVKITVPIKTNVSNKVQFAIDGSHAGIQNAVYSQYALGTGKWESLVVAFHVPSNADLLWLKIGMTTHDITPGEFIIGPVVAEAMQ